MVQISTAKEKAGHPILKGVEEFVHQRVVLSLIHI